MTDSIEEYFKKANKIRNFYDKLEMEDAAAKVDLEDEDWRVNMHNNSFMENHSWHRIHKVFTM